jgi:hypothetical protein
MLQPLYALRKNLQWVPDPVLKLSRREKLLTLPIRKRVPPSSKPVNTILNEMSCIEISDTLKKTTILKQ